MSIKVVAFDLDDTLWDMKPTLIRAERVLGKWLAENCPNLTYDVETMRQIREALCFTFARRGFRRVQVLSFQSGWVLVGVHCGPRPGNRIIFVRSGKTGAA